MNVEAHYRSLSAEFMALKDRVRNVIEDAHWQTDGEWRESILRAVLRRHLPDTLQVGRGFVTDGDRRSTQIDVLLYDAGAPLLYREQDLVIVTPDAVRGIIEVKSTIRRGSLLEEAVKLLQCASATVTEPGFGHQDLPILGLFAYDCDPPAGSDPSWILRELREAARVTTGGTVPLMCLGESHFVRFWKHQPDVWPLTNYNYWHLYHVDGMAPGYFVANIVTHLAHDSVLRNRAAWFPTRSKENHVIDRAPLEFE